MHKKETYQDVAGQIAAVTAGEPNIIARMATTACLLSEAFADFYWTGFYLVDPHKPDELVIGPYQGTLGCLRIAFSRGVCGAAARTGQTQLVDNVHDFPGHIACDSKTQSEIVIPVFNPDRKLIAVLDVDSTRLATFDKTDQYHLEKIIKATFGV